MTKYYKIEIYLYPGEKDQYYWSVVQVISTGNPGNWIDIIASGFANTPEDAAHAAKERYDKWMERRATHGNT